MNTTLLFVTLTIMAPAPKEAPKKEMPSLTGTWVGVAVEGSELAPPDVGKLTIEFGDGKMTIQDPLVQKPIQATFTVDTTKKIAEIDIRLGLPGAGKDDVIQGLYRITGDKLELCFNKDGKGGRPAEFKGDTTKSITFVTLKRIPDEKKP